MSNYGIAWRRALDLTAQRELALFLIGGSFDSEYVLKGILRYHRVFKEDRSIVQDLAGLVNVAVYELANG